jgi:short-subunit dehydrogenase
MAARTVVITGASAGIGRATAREFGRRKWRVALLARDTAGLEAARAEIASYGGEALAIPTDVADLEQVEAAATRIERTWGAIDVWVNNAMVTVFCEFAHMAPEDFRRATEVTYLGTVWGTRAALARMRPRNHGTIVQVSSALAYRSIPLQAAYCGAKSAIRGFTDALRSELIHRRSKIHLTSVYLSAFNTPQFDWGRTCTESRLQPLPPIFQPEIAATAIYYAATHRRRQLWVGWPAAKAILGTRLFPGTLDRFLAHAAYSGQHTGEPIPAGREDNLYEPLPGDRGAHGRFNARARAHSPQLWLAMHRLTALSVLAGVAALAFRSWRAAHEGRTRWPRRHSPRAPH